jgi:hypothetical protein
MKSLIVILSTFFLVIDVNPIPLFTHQTPVIEPPNSTDIVTGFLVRSDFEEELDEDKGWAASLNIAPSQIVDTPFRIRFEVESDTTNYRRQYSLQYRWNDYPWTYAQAHEFPYPSEASPPLSIVSSKAFFFGEEADDLISVSKKPANPGAGISLAPTTPGWIPYPSSGASAEWEWAIVIRRWADGGRVIESGDRFALRMVDQYGRPLSGPNPDFTVTVPEYHLGGVFVETPARIGPFENSLGHLYFIMEPTETDNIFMMVKSEDGGRTWFEVDSDNRPKVSDLEGVGTVMSHDGIIHIAHQVSEGVYYHAFAISDHPEHKDKWITDSFEITTHTKKPPTQTADITLRPDGSLIAVFSYYDKLQLSIRDPNGTWNDALLFNHEYHTGFTNPLAICRPDGVVDLVYKSLDGKGWHRQLLQDNSLSEPILFTENLGTTVEENISIIPLAFLPEKNSTIAVYRKSDGYLYLSHFSNNAWSEPLKLSDKKVISNAVDSEQTEADVVVFDNKLIITFIAEADRSIYQTILNNLDQTSSAKLIISNIDGSWVRGNILYNQQSNPVFGLVYDAGSKGGSGFNKYLYIDLGLE